MTEKDKGCREAVDAEMQAYFDGEYTDSSVVRSRLTEFWQAAWNRRAPEGLIDFVREVAQQKPEKPDYWSSCSQCERNSDKAQELLEAAPQPIDAEKDA